MLAIHFKRAFAIVAVAAGVLVPAASASAGPQPSGLVGSKGHADPGVSVSQHDQTDLEFLAAGIMDGTSNTIAFGARVAAPEGFSFDVGTPEQAADGRGAGRTLGIDLAGPFVPNN
jgi:hypothetical protein